MITEVYWSDLEELRDIKNASIKRYGSIHILREKAAFPVQKEQGSKLKKILKDKINKRPFESVYFDSKVSCFNEVGDPVVYQGVLVYFSKDKKFHNKEVIEEITNKCDRVRPVTFRKKEINHPGINILSEEILVDRTYYGYVVHKNTVNLKKESHYKKINSDKSVKNIKKSVRHALKSIDLPFTEGPTKNAYKFYINNVTFHNEICSLDSLFGKEEPGMWMNIPKNIIYRECYKENNILKKEEETSAVGCDIGEYYMNHAKYLGMADRDCISMKNETHRMFFTSLSELRMASGNQRKDIRNSRKWVVYDLNTVGLDSNYFSLLQTFDKFLFLDRQSCLENKLKSDSAVCLRSSIKRSEIFGLGHTIHDDLENLFVTPRVADRVHPGLKLDNAYNKLGSYNLIEDGLGEQNFTLPALVEMGQLNITPSMGFSDRCYIIVDTKDLESEKNTVACKVLLYLFPTNYQIQLYPSYANEQFI